MEKITKLQGQILNMLVEERLSVEQISYRLKKTKWAIYKIIKSLKEKGVLNQWGNDWSTPRGGYSNQNTKNQLRLHNIQISIKILSKEQKYLQFLKEANKFSISGVTVLCYYDRLDIYTQSGLDFLGQDTDECYMKAIAFFAGVYSKIENRLHITIEKDQYLNKKWVRQHIAECNNEIAKEQNQKKEQIRDYDKDDGKTWLLTDNSHKLNELEFVHPVKAKEDTEKVLKFVRDMRENPESMTLSEVSAMIKQIVHLQKEQAEGIVSLINLIKPIEPKDYDEDKLPDKKMLRYIG